MHALKELVTTDTVLEQKLKDAVAADLASERPAGFASLKRYIQGSADDEADPSEAQ